MRELDALQKQQNRKNFACQGAGKLTGLGVLLRCCSASLAHARPTMFYFPPSIYGHHVQRVNKGCLPFFLALFPGLLFFTGGLGNIIGRENLITSGRANELAHALWTEYNGCESFMADRMGLGSTTLHYLTWQYGKLW